MKINNFYQAWGTARAYVLTAIIMAFLVLTVRSYCYTLEMDYSGPGSEYERSMDHYRDKDNQDAAERCGRGEDRSGDREKADQYGRDHGA